MIVDWRVKDYIGSLMSARPGLLGEIEEKAKKEHVPILKQETAAFLECLITALVPEAILEIGTAVGYSALLMARVMPVACRITTIEKQDSRVREARKNFELAGETARIRLLSGDASVLLSSLSGKKFDFIFLDAAKGQYEAWFPVLFGLLNEGGVLLSDNVLQGGDVAQSRFAVERRNRTIHARMRAFLWELTHNPGLVTSVLPVGDGVAMSIKRGADRREIK